MSENEKLPGRLSTGAQVLQALFENGKSPLSDQFLRWKIWKRWQDLVGPSISAVSEPVGLSRGTLYIWVKNSTWMQQLIFMNDQVRDTINKKLGSYTVKEVRWTLDRRSLPSSVLEADELRRSISTLMQEGDGD